MFHASISQYLVINVSRETLSCVGCVYILYDTKNVSRETFWHFFYPITIYSFPHIRRTLFKNFYLKSNIDFCVSIFPQPLLFYSFIIILPLLSHKKLYFFHNLTFSLL